MDLVRAYVTICVISTAVALSVAISSWGGRRKTPAAGPLAFGMFGLAIGTGFMAAQVIVPHWARLFGLITLLAVSFVVAGFYCEVQALVDPDWRLRPRTVAWLSVHPLAVLVAGGLNPAHLFAHGNVVGGTPQMAAPPGPLLWLHVGYCYTLVSWCFQRLMRAMIWSNPLQRLQLRAILLSTLLPTVGAVAGLILSNPRQGGSNSGQGGLDVTPLSVALAGLVHYYAVFRQGLLRLLPVARDLVVEHMGDAILVMDTDDRVVDVNSAARRLAARMFNDLPGNLLGMQAWMLLPQREQRRVITDGEHHLTTPNGPLDLDLRVNEVTDKHGNLLGRVVVMRDITELNDQRRRLAAANQQLTQQLQVIEALRCDLAELTVRDELTGLHNRRHLMRQLGGSLDDARSSAKPLSLILLDIDHFKAVNDRHGHAVGDALLVATSAALQEGLRVGDTVARIGGEEFVVLLPNTSLDEALHMAEALRSRCATVHVESQHGSVSATVSAGVATFPECGWTGSELLANADEALYVAKRAGRNQVVCAPAATEGTEVVDSSARDVVMDEPDRF